MCPWSRTYKHDNGSVRLSQLFTSMRFFFFCSGKLTTHTKFKCKIQSILTGGTHDESRLLFLLLNLTFNSKRISKYMHVRVVYLINFRLFSDCARLLFYAFLLLTAIDRKSVINGGEKMNRFSHSLCTDFPQRDPRVRDVLIQNSCSELRAQKYTPHRVGDSLFFYVWQFARSATLWWVLRLPEQDWYGHRVEDSTKKKRTNARTHASIHTYTACEQANSQFIFAFIYSISLMFVLVLCVYFMNDVAFAVCRRRIDLGFIFLFRSVIIQYSVFTHTWVCSTL